MKIVTWNCNGAFRKKYDALEAFDADLLVVQECEDPAQSTKSYARWAGSYLWTGNSKNKGIGIFAKNGVFLEKLDWPDDGLQQFLPCRINDQFNLLAVWTMKVNSSAFQYIGQLWKYLQLNKERIAASPSTIICGDFNSNVIWDKKNCNWNHSDVVRELDDLGFRSLYHELSGERPGEEKKPTLFMQRKLDRPYHIDYAFVSRPLIGCGSIEVGHPDRWLGISDHMPIVFNLSLLGANGMQSKDGFLKKVAMSSVKKEKTLGVLFEKPPEEWGLRGDPFLWKDFEKRLSDFPWPKSCEELEGVLHTLFSELTGISLEREGHFFLEKYSHGGMSSGHIHLASWREVFVPLLLQRFYRKSRRRIKGVFVKLRVNNSQLDRIGLSEYSFPIPLKNVKSFLKPEFSLEELLYWLQCYAGRLKPSEECLDLEPVMFKLTSLLCPSTEKSILVQREAFRLTLGPVDLTKKIVTVQKEMNLIAALQDRGDGSLLVSIFRPLCEKAVSYLTGLSQNPSPDGTVCRRPNNWEYALDCSAGMGNFYAYERDEAYLSYWEYGLGKDQDGSAVTPWVEQQALQPISGSQAIRYFK